MEIPLKCAAYLPPGDCHGSSLMSLMFTFFTLFCHSDRSGGISYCFCSTLVDFGNSQRCLDFARHDNFLLFAVEVIRLLSFHDHFVLSFLPDCELAAVGIKTGIALRVIGDHVINKIFVAGVGELVRFAWLEEEGVARCDDCRSGLVANASATRHDEIKLRLARVRMIRTKRFALRNADQREIERMPLRQIERLRIAPKRHRDILRSPSNLPLRRLLLPFFDVLQMHFAHTQYS